MRMTELKRIMVDDVDLAIYKTEPNLITVWIEFKSDDHLGVCIASEPTELEALVAARLALFKLYKACPEPPRSQPNPLVNNPKV